jgi:arylsulfatase
VRARLQDLYRVLRRKTIFPRWKITSSEKKQTNSNCMKTKLILTALSLALICVLIPSGSAQSPAPSSGKKPNIVIIWGDDVGQSDISAYTRGLMGFQTPNIDRVAREGMLFTDYYAE